MFPENTQFHGFASQGFILTSDNHFFGDSEKGSFRFSELGLNTSIQFTPDFQFSAQVLSRQAGEGDEGDPRLDYGLLDYRWISSDRRGLGFRLGRIKNPLGFYNDTRDVAFTRPSILLPQSIYFDRTRNLALSADGAGVYFEYRTDAGNFFYELEVGYPEVDDEETKLAFIDKLPGSLDNHLSYISRLIFEKDGGKVRLGLSGAIVNIRYQPAPPFTSRGDIRFRPVIFSAQYNAERWSLTSEYALRYTKHRNVGGISDSLMGESIYFQGTYRMTQQFEALLRYDLAFQDRNDRNGKEFESTTPSGKPAHTQFAKDATVGLLWSITPVWMTRIEYHYVDGTAWLPLLDNPAPSMTKRYWDMFAILVSFRF
ncbi:MAG: hypothetical protein ACE5F7_03020 [Nitrospiria bacterium]